MTERQAEKLNYFFVETFNKILTWEDRALSAAGIENLSVKELHIIEAVARLQQSENHTMSQIAQAIEISIGALTTAVNTLVKKGYLIRKGREGDRRIVLVELTEAGQQANEKHAAFHAKMITQVGQVLNEAELETLTLSLDQLSSFFQQQSK